MKCRGCGKDTGDIETSVGWMHYECEIDRLTSLYEEANALANISYDREEELRLLCKAAYHLLKGSDAIYDPRGDTGPTHWLRTRDELIKRLEELMEN